MKLFKFILPIFVIVVIYLYMGDIKLIFTSGVKAHEYSGDIVILEVVGTSSSVRDDYAKEVNDLQNKGYILDKKINDVNLEVVILKKK